MQCLKYTDVEGELSVTSNNYQEAGNFTVLPVHSVRTPNESDRLAGGS